MTREEALKKSIEQWGWLTRHPDLDKNSYNVYNQLKKHPVNNCFLCQYVADKSVSTVEPRIMLDHMCKNLCPAYRQWKDGFMLHAEENGAICENFHSPYYEWDLAKDNMEDETVIQEYAAEVLVILYKALWGMP